MNVRQFLVAVESDVRRRADLPEKLALKVDPDWRKTRETDEKNTERILAKAGFGEALIRERWEMARIRDNPPAEIRQIRLLRWSAFARTWFPSVIGIDLEKRRIALKTYGLWNSDELFGKGDRLPHLYISVRLIGWLFAFLLLPVVVIADWRQEKRARRAGMSRHSLAVLEALEGRLDAETAALLAEAMRNSRAHDRKMARRVTFEEAKAVLAACDCRVTNTGSVQDDSPPIRWYNWRDDEGDEIAIGDWSGAGNCSVRVFSSWFQGRQASALLDCHR